MAPLAYIGRYMHGWWDYTIADELHELAQGNNLGVLYRCSRRLIGLTGTLMGGYADDLFHCSIAWSLGGWWLRGLRREAAADGTSPRNTV